MTRRRTQDGAWAITPVKRFDRAKSRLAGLLNVGERADLAKAMLGDVFDALARTRELTGVVVVTSDNEARAMASVLGFETAADAGESGLNDAVAVGLRYVRARGAAAALIVPGDIPFTTADEIRAVLRALATTRVVLAPAARDNGTNILAMAPTDAIRPAFGPGSAARHIAAARAGGSEPAILALSDASQDIDVPADLFVDPARKSGSRTRACLLRLDVANRLKRETELERATW
jgi:2-phospho-L-lactate guanylyltransferase